jgi:NitT/TauT family transport system substrate-binding protein
MLTAMMNKALDGAMQIEPLITKGEEDGVHVIFKDPSDYAPRAQIAITLASPQFVTDKKEAAKRFMIAYIRGLRDYNDAFVKGKNVEETIRIMVKYSTMKDPAVWRKVRPVGLNPDGYADASGIASDLAWYREKGYFVGDVDLKKVVDHSLADYAVSVLGLYE